MVMLDWMHAADLGILGYELGEALWSLLPALVGMPASTKARHEGFKVLKARLKNYYKENPDKVHSKVPMKKFTIWKIKGRGRPKLRAKAAQTRDLLPFVLQLATEFRDYEGDFGEDRFQSLTHLSKIYALAERSELSDQDLMEWRWWGALHMYYYVRCGFKVYPKHHYFSHLPQQAERAGVPRPSL